MTAGELAFKMELQELAMCDPEREIKGAYAGDLLSWVMGRATEGCVWATIMTNANVVAVASLVDTAAAVICEGSEISDEIVSLAKDKGVNLFRSNLPMYEFCAVLSRLLG